MVGRLIAPPAWRNKWAAVLAVMLWTVIVAIGMAVYLNRPPPPPAEAPIHILSHTASWTPEGRWRVETRVRIEAECQIAVTRRFNRDGDYVRQPVASYLDPVKPGNLPYLLTTRPGTGMAWYEYEPGQVPDQYLISVTAWECANGFSGPIGQGHWTVEVKR